MQRMIKVSTSFRWLSRQIRVIYRGAGKSLARPISRCILVYFCNTKRHKFGEEFRTLNYEGWNFNSGNYLFTTDTK